MGVLSGVLRGAGAGLSAAGASLAAGATSDEQLKLRREQLAQQAELERMREQGRDDRLTERLDAELARRGLAGNGSRTGSGGGGAGGVLDLGDPKVRAQMALAGGVPRADIDAATDAAMGAPAPQPGGTWGREDRMEPSARPRAEASAQQLQAASRAFLTAFMPDKADDAAKAQGTWMENDATRAAIESGDPDAIDRARVAGGKDVYQGEGIRTSTGLPAKGSVAEGTRSARFADAGKSGAQAARERSTAEGEAKDRDITAAANAVTNAKKAFDRQREKVRDDPMLKMDPAGLSAALAAIDKEQESSPAYQNALANYQRVAARGAQAEDKPAAKGGKTPPEAPRDAAQRQRNTIYNTPKGPLRWMGNGWARP